MHVHSSAPRRQARARHCPRAPLQAVPCAAPLLQGEATPTLLITFSEDELGQLQMPALAAAARHHRRKIAAMHER